jgi:endoglucanase
MKELFCLLLLGSISYAQLPLLQTENTYFVNAQTKEKVVLKGMNVSNNSWGFWEYPISDSLQAKGLNPLISPKEMRDFVFTSKDVANLAQLKGNFVRYCINDELFRTDNPKRENNISLLRNHISQLAQVGIYTNVCMQFCPGLDGHNDIFERDKPESIRLKSVFESDSIFAIWRDVWQFVASRLADMDAVAGYELLSEPRRPALVDASEQDLVNAYLEVIDSIRSVDNRHVIFVCEFNSSEANPGDTYWNNKLAKNVIDNGEQGVIWGRNWLELPNNIPNLAYVAHIYSPYEFTTGETATVFDENDLKDVVTKSAEWAYKLNRPLYVSEYGVTFFQTDYMRTKWLQTIHDAFDENHVSTTLWQYKELLTPWVDMSGTFGLWMHFYDESNLGGIVDGKITYSSEAVKQAAITSEVDKVLTPYFVENGKFAPFALVNNQLLKDEIVRYFGSIELGIASERASSTTHNIYLSSDYQLHFDRISLTGNLYISVFSAKGDTLLETVVPMQEGKAILNLNSIRKTTSQVLLVRYGQKEMWSAKILVP